MNELRERKEDVTKSGRRRMTMDINKQNRHLKKETEWGGGEMNGQETKDRKSKRETDKEK